MTKSRKYRPQRLTQNSISNKSKLLPKKDILRRLRQYWIPATAGLTVLLFTLVYMLIPADAGVITVTFDQSVLNAVNGTPTGSVSNTADGDNGTYYALQDRRSGTNFNLDVDFTRSAAVSGQGGKMYKLDLTINAKTSALDTNYYAQMFNGTAFVNFGTVNDLGQFGLNDVTVTKTLTDQALVSSFFNNGQPRVKIENAKSYNNGSDTSQSTLSIDYLAVRFYEDVTAPTVGALSPASNTVIRGSTTLTLAGVTDSEAGVSVVEFAYRPNGTSNPWTTIGTDNTPDAQNNYSISWNTALIADGSYEVAAFARDKLGTPNQASVYSSNIQIQNTTDNTPVNSASITSPANFKRVNNPLITANAVDSDGVVSKVEFYDSTNPAAPFYTDTVGSDGWTATWNTTDPKYVDGQSCQVWVKAYNNNTGLTPAVSTSMTYIVDKTSPSVRSTDPVNGSTTVPTNRPEIKAVFDGPMDQASIQANTSFKLVQNDNSVTISGQITGYDPAAYTATFRPDTDLAAEKTFTATLTSGIKDEAGNSLTAYSWQFTTIDTSSPVISAITPADGTNLKSELKVISATAADNVAVTKVDFYWQDAAKLNGWQLFGSDTNGADGWSAALNTANLPGDGQYQVKAVAYDARGNPPASKTVTYIVDITLPQVVAFSQSPADGSRDLPLNTSISASFNEAMNSSTFTSNASIYLTKFGSAQVVPTNLTYASATKTFTMTPVSVLEYNTQYTVHVTTAVTDTFGNPLASEATWSFTTIADFDPPVLTVQGVSPGTISPQNNDGRNDAAVVTFNLNENASVTLDVYDVNGIRVYTGTPVLYNPGSSLNISWNGKNTSGQFVPDGYYLLFIEATDPSGNSTRKDISNMVAVDNKGPIITQAVAENRSKIKISFNEAIDTTTGTNKFNYTVYETQNPLAALAVTQVTRLDSMNFLIETSSLQRTDRINYTVSVSNVEDINNNLLQSPTTVVFMGFNPHGIYAGSTSMCGKCHLTHTSQGGRLVSSSKIKTLCYTCHDTSGDSTYNTVKTDFQKTSRHPVEINAADGQKTSCEECHNVHGDKVNTETLYPKLLRAKNTQTGQLVNQGNEYCWACHGTGSTLPGVYGDKQTFYPADGQSHNKNDFETYPDGDPRNTGIRCTKCHDKHGSTNKSLIVKSLTYNGVTTTINPPNGDVSKELCYACHTSPFDPIPGTYSDSDWDGKAVYDGSTSIHASKSCASCHDSHSTRYSNFLRYSYDQSTGTTRTKPYVSADFQSCNGSCHYHESSLDVKFTQQSKDIDPGTQEPTVIPTGFWNETLYKTAPTDPRVNLHKYHLTMESTNPGRGNATCKECHRPHGAISAENPDGYSNIGFPSDTVSGLSFADPKYSILTGGKIGGSCNLSCHGYNHLDTKYESGGGAAGGNRNADCYSCHNTGAGPAGSVNMDIQSLMGSDGSGGLPSKHIVNNVFADLAGNNGCLLECHQEHSVFDNKGRANNTQFMTWNDTTKIKSNDTALCQNCHTDSSSTAAPVTLQFSNTLHGKNNGGSSYEFNYHDYGTDDGSVFKGNCLKCHNPHGTNQSKLLDFKSGSTVTGNTTITGNNNSVCDLCHINGIANTPNYSGRALYNKTAHGNQLIKLGDTENGHCDSCHDPHGKTDGSGLIPHMLKLRGVASCYDCHDGYKSLTPDWPGRVTSAPDIGYDTGAHKQYANDGKAGRGTGYCEVCHAVHGTNDGTGNPFSELLSAKEEGSCYVAGAAGSCHGTNGKSTLNGNKNIDIQTPYNKTFKHGDITPSGKHSSTEVNTAVAGWMPSTNRHAECEDCHNSHSAKATVNSTTLSTGDVKTSGVGVWGITLKDGNGQPIADPGNPALWPAAGTVPANTSFTIIPQAVKEWQVCAKCHSAWAYGTSKPAVTKWDGTADTGGQTDMFADFNPNNLGHHAVITAGKNQPGSLNPNFANTFVTPRWGPGARVACSDCHSSDISSDAKGTHGSNYRYLLVKNTTGSGTLEVFCLNCHKLSVYGDPLLTPTQASYSRVNHPINNAHVSSSYAHSSGIWCLNCHMGDVTGGSHGSNRGPGTSIKTGYVNESLGKRLMNGAAMQSYNSMAGSIACYTQGSGAPRNGLSACSKAHGGQAANTNYNY